MIWAEKLKIAIVTKNTQEIAKLINQPPAFDDIATMREVSYLIREAFKLISHLKDETLVQMNQIKKNIEFLESTLKRDDNFFDKSY